MPLSEAYYTKLLSNPQFTNWFGDSKVVDDVGRPLPVYHGSLHEIETFDKAFCNPKSFFGPGFYFSSSVEDVNNNYACIDSLERKGKISESWYAFIKEKNIFDLWALYCAEIDISSFSSHEKEQFFKDKGIKNVGSIYAKLQKWFCNNYQNQGIIHYTFLKSLNPLFINKNIYFNIHSESAEIFIKQIISSIITNLKKKTDEGQKYFDILQCLALSYDSKNNFFSWATFYDNLHTIIHHTSDDIQGIGPLFQNIIRSLGYDGIKQENANIIWDRPDRADHWVVFESTQIKAVYNKGTFDPYSPNIRE